MDEHICSLAEAVLVTTDEGGGSDFMFPIIDVLDKVGPRSPGHAQQTHRRASQVSSSSTSDPPLRRKCSLALDRICAAYGILPTRYPNIGNLIVAGEGPGDCGGTSDVWRGEADGNPVAVKVTRRYSTVPVARAQEVRSHQGDGSRLLMTSCASAILPRGSRLGKVVSSQHLTFPWS